MSLQWLRSSAQLGRRFLLGGRGSREGEEEERNDSIPKGNTLCAQKASWHTVVSSTAVQATKKSWTNKLTSMSWRLFWSQSGRPALSVLRTAAHCGYWLPPAAPLSAATATETQQTTNDYFIQSYHHDITWHMMTLILKWHHDITWHMMTSMILIMTSWHHSDIMISTRIPMWHMDNLITHHFLLQLTKVSNYRELPHLQQRDMGMWHNPGQPPPLLDALNAGSLN